MKIIKSIIPFSDNFIPPTLPAREADLVYIKRFLEPINQGEPTAANLFITGSVGVGKTIVSKHILYSIPPNIPHAYLPIKDPMTPHTIISDIFTSFFPGTRTKGISSSKLHSDLLKRMHHIPALLIIDEIDNTPLPSIRPILHSFSRESWITMFIISRKPMALDDLPEDTKSSLKLRKLIFRTYKKEDLKLILQQRIDMALYPNTITEEAIMEIAKYASYFGSARLAIDLLRLSCEETLGEKITIKEAREAIKLSEINAMEESIEDLPQTHRLLLQSIHFCEEREPPPYQQVLQYWQNLLAKNNLPVFSRWKFYDVVKDLKNLQFIETQKHGRGKGRGFINILLLQEPIKEYFKIIRNDRATSSMMEMENIQCFHN